MLALVFSPGLRWVIIGATLLLAWYILAPLFTPGALARRGAKAQPGRSKADRNHRRGKRKGQDLEVIEGDGRIIE